MCTTQLIDPVLNLLKFPPFENLSSMLEYNLALDFIEKTTEWSFLIKQNVWSAIQCIIP